MTDLAPSTPSLPLRELQRALRTICWGTAVALLCNLGFTSATADDRVSIDVMAIIGLGIVIVGVRDLPFARVSPRLRAQQRAAVVLAAIALLANGLTLVATLNTAMLLTAQAAASALLFLIMVITRSAMSIVGADALADWWRRLATTWLVLGTVGFTFALVMTLAFREAPPSSGSGWRWSIEPVHDHGIWWWVLSAAIGLSVVTFAAGIATLVVAIRTLGWLTRHGEPAPPPPDGPKSEPIETGGPGGPRLGRAGDRVVYYVDPPP